MTEKTLTTENIKPAIDALRGELAPWPVVAMKQDKLNDTQKSAVNSGITSGLVAQIIANTAAIRALESAITGTGLRPLVVASLPAIGTQGILYIVPVTTYDPATDADVVNYSNEYIWIVAPDAPVTQGYYEQVGQTGIVINDGQLTITVNGTSVGTFTANQSGDTTAAITVPTNSDYVDLTTAQTAAGVKTFSDGIVGNVTGTASKAISDADGNTISSTYGKLAGSQTWTQTQTFSDTVKRVNSSVVKGTNPSSDTLAFTNLWGGTGVSSLSSAFFTHRGYVNADGSTMYQITVTENVSSGGTYTSISLKYDPNATNKRSATVRGDLLPYSDNSFNLGSASYKWKTLNGINPGALSLPDIAQYVDLTANIPAASLDGNTDINLSSYTTSDGWLSIVVPDTNADDFVFCQNGSTLYNRFFMSGARGNGFISLMMPINSTGGVNAKIKASSVTFCRFYPCLGNV